MASPDKIGNRRGQDKWFSDAELERWAEAQRPVRRFVRPAQRLGVVEPEHHETQSVHSDRAAPAAQRGAVEPGLGFLGGGAAPEDLGVRVPGEPRVVEDGALNGGSPTGRKPSTRLRVRGKRNSAFTTARLEPMSWSSSGQLFCAALLIHSWLITDPAV